MEEAVKTLESFCHEPWTTIPFGRESLSAETYCTQKENMLNNFEQILKGIFLPQAHDLDLFLSFVNLANLLGKISLNCQERTPFPPVVLYLDNLKDLASSMTQEILEISKANDLRQKALHQAKGQALFKLHSGLNHSCAPNALVVTPKEDATARLELIAIQNIDEGEEICISYIYEDMEISKRKTILKGHYLFDCLCKKCHQEQ